MTSSPIHTAGNFTRKGESMIFINHIAPNIDEISVKAGYPYSDAVPVAVYYSSGESTQKIMATVLSNAKSGKCSTGSDLNMYLDIIVDETAWSRNVDVDQKAVASMRKGYFLITKGRSPKGTCSVDVYSLLGFSSVYEKMLKECN
ncbi:hypothetical protein GUI12_01585 [Anaplasmataceae bacterium AB001_6]|nr:hypothetical protein GUI12_01585 [Anaplasmataceae bacterium AB001_6]